MNKYLGAIKSMDIPKHPKLMPLEMIFTESLTINWVISSYYTSFLNRQIDYVMGSTMLIEHYAL